MRLLGCLVRCSVYGSSVCVCLCTRVCICVCVYVSVSACVSVYVSVHLCTCCLCLTLCVFCGYVPGRGPTMSFSWVVRYQESECSSMSKQHACFTIGTRTQHHAVMTGEKPHSQKAFFHHLNTFILCKFTNKTSLYKMDSAYFCCLFTFEWYMTSFYLTVVADPALWQSTASERTDGVSE